jgi:hypothetical protein
LEKKAGKIKIIEQTFGKDKEDFDDSTGSRRE